MNIIDGDKINCSRCDELISLEDANVLGKRNNRTYAKPLCDDCLKNVGVPRGYELERDVSYLIED
ncbi:hypothetical protein [Natrarchaeobaculum sulfurireducens]|uniref:Uncharacterized protein n=1 Tax=Natrarchaeobaculum sulfurireducens TaxID=2044521 RepID=A0A346PNT6_9EURY|nr:hypothetical protein [Natrarchaeobaculum sulfurireducens]AXR78771.1 hypothetical protein AArc1_2456 [Natrarchaeobaculum sulfurireducens]AXR81181.1 hypothetical protein AArcMg_1165 [Natrarchaeobaculum sulfurireducens]